MFDPGSLRHPTNKASYAYWDRIRRGRRMPSRADFDPAAMPRQLPCVFLLEVQAEPLDFRYRLIGTKMAEYMRGDYTGKWMSQIGHQRAPSRIFSACAWVVENREPLAGATPYVGKNADFMSTEDLIMPLSDDGGEQVTTLLVTADFLT